MRSLYESGEFWDSRHNMTAHSIRPDELSNTLSTVLKDNLLIEIYTNDESKGSDNLTEVIKHELAMPVTVRKHVVDTEALRLLLRNSKCTAKLTNRQISHEIDRPITEVEHWFRTDACFSIPDAEIWAKLKGILAITVDEFDRSITEFVEQPGVFEKANRFYDINGISPTLTVASADEKIFIEADFASNYKPKEDDVLTNAKPFNYVSLFSGIGGFEQALNKLGGTCVMASEIDRFANQSYEILYGHPTVGDITKIQAEDVPDHDVLVGGFPCQAFSVAGKRLGFEDTRGTLFFEIARIAKVKQPKVLLLENVKGLISHDKGNTLTSIITTLSDVGYTVDFDVMNSKYFGVPQNRERIFIVAVRKDLVPSAPWTVIGTNVIAKGKRRIAELPGVKTFNFDFPQQTEVTTRLRDILESDVDERFYLSEEKTAKLVVQLEDAANEKGEAKLTQVASLNLEGYAEMSNRVYSTEGLARTLMGGGGNAGDKTGLYTNPQMLGHIDIKGHDAIKRVYDPQGISPTLTTMGGGNTEPKIAETMYRIRKLTPKECFRLQGFADSEFEKLVEGGLSNSQLYKQAGNAVTVNVISAIGKRIIPYLAGN